MNIGYDFDGVITENVFDTNILGERYENPYMDTIQNYMILEQIKEQIKNKSKLFIVSKNTKQNIVDKIKNMIYISLFIDTKNIHGDLSSKVDIIKKLKLNKFYDDSVDNIHEINTKLRKQQLYPLELFLVKPEENKIVEIMNDNLRLLTYNTNWKNMFAVSDAPNPLCKKKSVCATNVVNLIIKQLPLDFIFIQEAITSEFDVLNSTHNIIITKSGLESIHTFINKSYPKPLKIISGEFELGRPFHIIILNDNLCLINVHFGHKKDIKTELKIINYAFEKEYDVKKIKKLRICMAGDFNMYIKELPKFFNKCYMKTQTKGTCCLSSNKFNFIDKNAFRNIYNLKNIDYIFDSNNDIVYSLIILPFDDNNLLLPASDHIAVFAELKK